MSPRTGTKPDTSRGRPASLLQHDIAAVLIAGLLAALLCAVLVREPARVDQVTVTNPTAYELTIQARSGPDQAWMPLAVVSPGTTVSALHVIDQGETWTFRLTGQGRDAGTFDLTGAQLRDAGWRLAVPAAIGDQLRDDGASPTPRTTPPAT
jgi:hypothetical protein